MGNVRSLPPSPHFPLDFCGNGKLINKLAESRGWPAETVTQGNLPLASRVLKTNPLLEAAFMKLSDRVQDGVVVLEPKGKIMGGPDASLLHDKLYDYIKQNKKKVVVDLAQVDWMNSTGLGILISALSTLKSNQGELKLANVTDKIQSLLTITKLVTVFESYDSVDQAAASFR